MIDDKIKGNHVDDVTVKLGSDQQNLKSYQSLAVDKTEAEQSLMEMEGRGYSDIFRNTSEDLFLKSLMENPIGMPIPTMEILGLKNLSQTLRTDSEELFKSWLTNGENHGHSSTSMGHRPRQASRRMSTELANMSYQQHEGVLQKKRNNDDLIPHDVPVADDNSNDLNQNSNRDAVERGLQASNLFLAKAWFHSSQPMTRSRSSELRKRYAAMQIAQTTIGVEAQHNASGQGVNKLKQEFGDHNVFNGVPMCQVPNQLGIFTSPSNSSSSTFHTSQMGTVDKVSSVVSMLKGTLERKKLNNHFETEAVEDSSNVLLSDQEDMVRTILDHGKGNHFHEMPSIFQEAFPVQLDPAQLQTVEGPITLDLEGIVTPTNPNQLSAVSQEPSQSESSAAAPVVSSGLDACDGPSNSGQTLTVSECSRKEVGNSRRSENGSKAKDFRERMFDNLKDGRKRGNLSRYGSVSSTGSAISSSLSNESFAVDKGDPTKKRRVERSRKMAEAKERSSTPAIPSDMQSVLKRCENLEKEVRSLKLNLSFMNRKDSEQTKEIEELQKQNEELAEEKKRLLEEIERIISKMGRM